jgi:dolichyl-phosphate beta-glucosyltransferase
MEPKYNSSYDVSLIIPIYRGSSLLEKHWPRFLSWLRDRPYQTEIILVDDGSPDSEKTSAFARKYGLFFIGLPANRGKGAALRMGFGVARGAIRLFTDADIPFQYHNIDTFVALLRQCPHQLLIGDRTDPLSVYFEKNTMLRNAGSHVVSFLVNRFFTKSVRDTQCGLKGMGKEVALRLFTNSHIDRFAIDIELIYLARKNNIPVHKVPVQLRYNDTSTVHAAKDGLRLLQEIYRIRKIHGKKRYE